VSCALDQHEVPFRVESGNSKGVHLPDAKVGRDALDLFERVDALHRSDDAPRREQVRGQSDDFVEFRECA
jgi:hypothetical protein